MFAVNLENNMIVRIGYCTGEACHDLRRGGLEASVPMCCIYDGLSHKAVHQEQDAGKTTMYIKWQGCSDHIASLPRFNRSKICLYKNKESRQMKLPLKYLHAGMCYIRCRRLQSFCGSIRTWYTICLLYTSPSPRDRTRSRMPSSA